LGSQRNADPGMFEYSFNCSIQVRYSSPYR
jgi:hypothetical protein